VHVDLQMLEQRIFGNYITPLSDRSLGLNVSIGIYERSNSLRFPFLCSIVKRSVFPLWQRFRNEVSIEA
jgi:hypothetical protein